MPLGPSNPKDSPVCAQNGSCRVALHDLVKTDLGEGERSRLRSALLNSPNRYSFAGFIDNSGLPLSEEKPLASCSIDI